MRDELRESGADRLLAARVSVFGAHPPSPGFPGIEVDAFVALSADGDLVAPVTDVTDMVFDLSAPDDPSWKAWAQDVKGSSEAGRARSCVDPDA